MSVFCIDFVGLYGTLLAVWHSTSAMELPNRSFSCRTWISSSLKAAKALGLLPLLFRFRFLYFDWSALLRLDVFHKAKFIVFFFKWWSKLAKNALKELGLYSLLSFLWTVITNLRRNLLSSCLISPFKTRNLWNRATFSWYSHFPVHLTLWILLLMNLGSETVSVIWSHLCKEKCPLAICQSVVETYFCSQAKIVI